MGAHQRATGPGELGLEALRLVRVAERASWALARAQSGGRGGAGGWSRLGWIWRGWRGWRAGLRRGGAEAHVGRSGHEAGSACVILPTHKDEAGGAEGDESRQWARDGRRSLGWGGSGGSRPDPSVLGGGGGRMTLWRWRLPAGGRDRRGEHEK